MDEVDCGTFPCRRAQFKRKKIGRLEGGILLDSANEQVLYWSGRRREHCGQPTIFSTAEQTDAMWFRLVRRDSEIPSFLWGSS